MPSPQKSTMVSKKVTENLKRKVSKVINANLLKKTRRPTDDTLSSLLTPSKVPTQTSDNETTHSPTILNVDTDTGDDESMIEDSDAELGMSSFLVKKLYLC